MTIPDRLKFGKETNLEAIPRLAVILENTPDENFNIGSWTCGTVHCAAGLAARDPWFNKHGFYLDEYGVVSFKNPYDPLYYPNYHWQAVSAIFKIAAAEALASLVENPTADEVVPSPFDERVVPAVADVIR